MASRHVDRTALKPGLKGAAILQARAARVCHFSQALKSPPFALCPKTRAFDGSPEQSWVNIVQHGGRRIHTAVVVGQWVFVSWCCWLCPHIVDSYWCFAVFWLISAISTRSWHPCCPSIILYRVNHLKKTSLYLSVTFLLLTTNLVI